MCGILKNHLKKQALSKRVGTGDEKANVTKSLSGISLTALKKSKLPTANPMLANKTLDKSFNLLLWLSSSSSEVVVTSSYWFELLCLPMLSKKRE